MICVNGAAPITQGPKACGYAARYLPLMDWRSIGCFVERIVKSEKFTPSLVEGAFSSINDKKYVQCVVFYRTGIKEQSLCSTIQMSRAQHLSYRCSPLSDSFDFRHPTVSNWQQRYSTRDDSRLSSTSIFQIPLQYYINSYRNDMEDRPNLYYLRGKA